LSAVTTAAVELIKKMVKMLPKRLLAIGDIHGYTEKLIALLDVVQPSEDDHFVFLGDYIDRGPHSLTVINNLLDFRARFPKTVFLRGNHEQALLDLIASGNAEDLEFFLKNGGDTSLESYGGIEAIPEEHMAFIRATKMWHLEEVASQQYLFVHAGVKPKRPLVQQVAADLLWIRDPFLKSPKPLGELIVVHGHTPSPNVPSKAPYRIAVDSGVYIKGPLRRSSKELGGKLTCCNVLTRETWQA
jgi:serine/threonine protein phosphatase 1